MIFIDRRTGSVELAKYFPEELVEIKELEFGDFAFSGKGPDGDVLVGIERKTISDLVDSIKTGRLWGHQVPGMAEMYDFNYIIIEGVYKPQPKYLMLPCGKKWRRIYIGTDVIDPYLNTIQVLTGFMIRETGGKKQTASMVEHLYHWWQREFNDHGEYGPYQRPVRLPKKLTNGALLFKVSQVLPGIGLKKGLNIKEHFGSVLEMVNAPEEDWLEIPDIGPKTAREIREALGHT